MNGCVYTGKGVSLSFRRHEQIDLLEAVIRVNCKNSVIVTWLQFTCDCAVDLGAVLELNSHRLMAELHQKSVETNEIA